MSTANGERLYSLLPAIYRIRDAEQGQSLRALMGVLEAELRTVETDIADLYENWFIETCAEWVVPYIGDLLGVKPLSAAPGVFSLRAYVANTLAYRSRKGTASAVEQLARDVTGWRARVVEFFERLCTTQYLNHLRPEALGTPDLRQMDTLDRLGGAFESTTHTAEVRRIQSGRGRYNISNVGVFLWRLESYAVSGATARLDAAAADRRYRFHPLGKDAPLFTQPLEEEEITHLAEEVNVPGPIRRRALDRELEAIRTAYGIGVTPHPEYMGEPRPAIRIVLDDGAGHLTAIQPEELIVCDLSDWDPAHAQLPASQNFPKKSGGQIATKAAVDPQTGRFVLLTSVAVPAKVLVSYSYGFSGDVGGGPYDRRDSVARGLTSPGRSITWQKGVTQDAAVVAQDPGVLVGSLSKAIQDWNAFAADPANKGAFGVIAVMDSATYDEALPEIKVFGGTKLVVVAADWPIIPDPEHPGQNARVKGHIEADGLRPHLAKNLSVKGMAAAKDPDHGEAVLDGFLIEGSLTVTAGNLGSLRVAHCTVAGAVGITVKPANAKLNLQLERSVSTPVTLPVETAGLSIQESLLWSDPAVDGTAILGSGTSATVLRSTIFGRCKVKSLDASDSLFTGLLQVARRQQGCLRFSYAPSGSETPRRYHCQPDQALLKRATELGLASIAALPNQESSLILTRLRPVFASFRPEDPQFFQLAQSCAMEIVQGAEDGSEMGVFGYLKQPQRISNLYSTIEQYLCFGLEAGHVFVT